MSTGQSADNLLIAKGAGLSLSGKILGRGLQVIAQIVLARTLGPLSYGLYAIGWTVLRIVSLLAPLGLDRAVLRFGAQSKESSDLDIKGVILDSFFISVASGAAVGTAVFALAPWLAEYVFRKPEVTDVLRIFAIAFPVAAGLKVCVAAIWSTRRVRIAALAEDLGQPALNLALVIAAFYLSLGLVGAASAAVLSFVLSFAAAVYFSFLLLRRLLSATTPIVHEPKRLLAFSLPAALAGAMPVFLTWVDRIVVGVIRPADEMGVYHAVSQFSILFSIVLSGIGGGILGPMIARLYSEGERDRLQGLFRVTTKWGLYMSVPAFLIMCIMPLTLLTVVYGNDYQSGTVPLVILAFAGFVNAGTGPVGMLLVMTGRERVWLAISFGALVLDIALLVALTPSWGLTGAALGRTIATTVMFATGIIACATQLRLWPYDRRYLKGALAAGVAAAAILLVTSFQIPILLVELLFGAIAATVVFCGMLWLLGLDEEDQQMLKWLWEKMGNQFSLAKSR